MIRRALETPRLRQCFPWWDSSPVTQDPKLWLGSKLVLLEEGTAGSRRSTRLWVLRPVFQILLFLTPLNVARKGCLPVSASSCVKQRISHYNPDSNTPNSNVINGSLLLPEHGSNSLVWGSSIIWYLRYSIISLVFKVFCNLFLPFPVLSFSHTKPFFYPHWTTYCPIMTLPLLLPSRMVLPPHLYEQTPARHGGSCL